ncbi:helix-turn-helix domain-containing protein [Rhizobium sp. Nf11,1]|uniref:helix-turn-helix domain-containing protein n=1 Tax=Rhizobium sp. Nf11,1 TaxID=3404923 RepID=UPI003D32BFBF
MQEGDELDAVQLGANLKRARERSGKSQQEVAEALAMPRTAVTNLEAGNRAVSTLELSKLANLYGQPIASFFGRPKSNMEELSVVLPRALPAVMASNEMGPAVDRIVDLYTEGAKLRELLGGSIESAVPNYAMKAGTVGESLRQAELVAHEERRRLGLGAAPVGNIAALIASQGIWTAATELPDDLSGLFLNHASIGLAVIVNGRHHPVRRRFSYAHEYAHALFDREEELKKTERANASDMIEKRANAFAAAFLMPSDGIAEQLRLMDKGNPSRQSQILFDVAGDKPQEAEIRPPAGSQAITYQEVMALAQHFGVSYEAMVWRLKSVGKINSAETDLLVTQKDVGNRYGQALQMLRDPDGRGNLRPEDGGVEIRAQITRLAIEAYRRGEISAGRLRDLSRKLPMEADDLLDFAEAARAE